MPSDEMVLAMIEAFYRGPQHSYSEQGAAQVAHLIRTGSPSKWKSWQAAAEAAIRVGL